jgi:hypothetical protein
MMTPPPFSATDLLSLFIASLLIAIPAGMLLKKTGHNPFWALLVFFPPLAVIGLWVLALRTPGAGQA